MDDKQQAFIRWGLQYTGKFCLDTFGELCSDDGHMAAFANTNSTIYRAFLYDVAEGFNRQSSDIWIEIHKTMVSIDSRNLWDPIDFVFLGELGNLIGAYAGVSEALEAALKYIYNKGWKA